MAPKLLYGNQYITCWLLLFILVQSHLLTFVIDIEASGVILILVGDLQPMRMTNLVRLKGGV